MKGRSGRALVPAGGVEGTGGASSRGRRSAPPELGEGQRPQAVREGMGEELRRRAVGGARGRLSGGVQGPERTALAPRIGHPVGVVEPLHERAADDPPQALEGPEAPLQPRPPRLEGPALLLLGRLHPAPLRLVAPALLVERVEGLALRSVSEAPARPGARGAAAASPRAGRAAPRVPRRGEPPALHGRPGCRRAPARSAAPRRGRATPSPRPRPRAPPAPAPRGRRAAGRSPGPPSARRACRRRSGGTRCVRRAPARRARRTSCRPRGRRAARPESPGRRSPPGTPPATPPRPGAPGRGGRARRRGSGRTRRRRQGRAAARRV